MKVNLFRSLGAKLFYYMSLLVLITVAGNSFQYVRTFLRVQTDEVQDKIVTQAGQAGGQVENQIRTWRSQIAVALPSLRAIDAQGANAPIQRFVDSSPDFVSLELFSAADAKATTFEKIGEAFTSDASDKRFEDRVPKNAWAKIKSVSPRFLKREVRRVGRDKFTVDSIAKSTNLPLMMLAARFDVADSKQVVWAVLTTWQEPIIKSMPKSEFVTSAVIDRKGKVFTSPAIEDMIQRKEFSGKQLATAALKAKEPSGFVPEYKNSDGKRRLGAYYRIVGTKLAVLVEQDAEHAYTELKKNLLATALWSLLFILLAVGFSFVGAAGITKSLRAVTEATQRIASGDFQFRLSPTTKDEVALLSASVNNMSHRIVNLMKSQVDKARFEKELETARMVQGTFFPKADIRIGPVFVTGFYQPASECGGDLWGHFTIEEGVEFVFIADAMGHGAPAALVTAMAYSTAMTIADIMKDEGNTFRDSPSKILQRLNRIIYEAVRGTISMTFFASIIDTKRGTITFANAGHNFPVIIPAEANDPRAGKGSKQLAKISDIAPISLKLMGTPLGMDPSSQFKEQKIELKAGDKIFYFTDGLIECSSPDGSVWGRKTLLEQLVDTAKMSGEGMKDEVLRRAFGFFAQKPLDDDVTVMVTEIAKTWQPSSQPAPTKGQVAATTAAAVAKEADAVVAPEQAAALVAKRPAAPPGSMRPNLPPPVSHPPLAQPLPQPTRATDPAPQYDSGSPPLARAPIRNQQPAQPEQKPSAPPSGRYKIKLPSTG